ncbi:hypothetical protein GCM10028857_01230 [Salinarchaeum chitinilyticum]
MQSGRVSVVDSDALAELTTVQLRDAIAATDPHAIVATSPGARVRLRSTLAECDRPVITPGTDANSDDSGASELSVHRLGEISVVVPESTSALASLPELESDGAIDDATETYVLTDHLELSVRPTELATVRVGLEDYRDAIRRGEVSSKGDAGDSLRGSYTHLSTGLPTGYYGDWEGLTVRGAAPGQIDGAPTSGTAGTETTVPCLELGTDGAVATTTYRRDSLGLRAIDGVGEQRARTLRDAGYPDRDALATADVATLADRDGLARSTASRLVDRARAFQNGRVRRTSDERLPGPEPIFVDIETDGLSPSVVWLIGVLDREAETPYRSFLAIDPDDPATALADFCTWLAGHARNAENAPDRPIVAYNGDSFDFPVLAELIDRHCPRFGEHWADAWTFDPYSWAVRAGNAVLPGRTNRLEDVAEALDVDPVDPAGRADGTPLSGAEVARIYRSWMDHPVPENEPEWERLEAYCEADVRALAGVYDAIAAADRVAGEPRDREVSPETTQGSLGDFG